MNGEVAVVGGGIIGMSIAWRLAQAGASVTVFDAGRIGNEASWAGAGMLAPGGEIEERTEWSDFALESLASYPAFIEELTHASGVAIDFRQCGAFDFAFSDEEAAALRERATRQNDAGIYSEQFHPRRVPGVRQDAVAAQYYPGDAVVNPRDVMHALTTVCLRARVELREFEPISQVENECTVLAAGAWTSQIRTPVPIPQSIPVRGHLIAFEEHGGLCDSIVRHGHTYLLRRSGDLIVAGTSTEHAGYTRTLDGDVAADIARRAGQLVPALAGRGYMVWNGFRPASSTGHPVIGRLEDTPIWLAYGHYRNGILLAPATARRVAADIMRTNARTDSLSPSVNPQ